MSNTDYTILLKKSLQEIQSLKSQLRTSSIQDTKIAIVGIGCKLPLDIDNPLKLWEAFLDGSDAITNIPKSRWDVDKFFNPDQNNLGTIYTKKAGIINDIELFDPLFFNISPKEAIEMDPQQRMLLEVVWSSLEDSGIQLSKLQTEKTGIFIGMGSDDYSQLNINAQGKNKINNYTGVGNSRSVAAGRLAYFLGTNGPSIQIDTSCSSSLVATHLACQSLRLKESNIAIVAGVNLLLSPLNTIMRSRLGALSKDGYCKTFDASADGFVQGDGCLAVILKTLDQAKLDNDKIYAIIEGSVVNHNGKSSGLTAPNQNAQERLISDTLKISGIDVSAIDYIEAHGTGTKLGDPIEMAAVANVFNSVSHEKKIFIGSAKSNFGHLEAAAGILSLVKTALSIYFSKIPPSIHYHTPNPYIDWSHIPFKVPTTVIDIPIKNAGVSSFGMNGTNAHLILSKYEHMDISLQPKELNPTILVFSAKTEEALTDLLDKFIDFFHNTLEHPLNISYTANACRTHFDWRFAITLISKEDMINKITALTKNEVLKKKYYKLLFRNHFPNYLAYLYSGQGSQYTGMGKDLYNTHKAFKKIIDYCSDILEPKLGHKLTSILWGDESKYLKQTIFTQPCLFVFEYALTQLWLSWGIVPKAVLGHSVGEYVAACVAGVMSLEDGLSLIQARAKLMQELPLDGGMATVFVTEDQIYPYIKDEEMLSIAAINGPQSLVLSGSLDRLSAVLEKIRSDLGTKHKMLEVSHAFHSPLMKPILEDFRKVAAKIKYSAPNITLISNITGKPVVTIDANYWIEHLIKPVRFFDGMNQLIELGFKHYLEVSPRGAIINMAQEWITTKDVLWLESIIYKNETEHIINTLGTLFTYGYEINWQGYFQDQSCRKVSLPTYPFQRKKFWRNEMENTILEHQIKLSKFDPSNQLIESITCKIGKLLGIGESNLRQDVSLPELGADSIMLVTLKKILEEDYDVKLTIRQLFEEINTIEQLANFIINSTQNHEFEKITINETNQINKPQIEQLSTFLVDSVSQLLTIHKNEIRLDTPLLELGADSITLVSLVKILKDKYDIHLSIRQLFEETNTIQKIADFITSQQAPDSIESSRIEDNHKLQIEKKHDVSANSELINELKKLMARVEDLEINKGPKVNLSKLDKTFHDNKDIVDNPEVRHLTAIQNEYLNNFINLYNNKTKQSKLHFRNYQSVLCNNRRSSSGFRLETKELLYPIIAKNSQGSKFVDTDDNEYVDIAMGYGAHFFGHNPEFIQSVITKQVSRGWHIGPEIQTTGLAAKAIAQLTKMERILFCNSGTEAVMTAMRIARSATSKPKIAIFSNAYHGHFDGTLVLPLEYDGNKTQPGVHGVTQSLVNDTIVLPFDNERSFEIIKQHAHELAAVMIEPVQNRRPDLHPKEFLQKLREVTKENKVLLIFDEILVGFRIHVSGAQAWFGVEADIATYGKVVAGGLPIGIVAGKSKFMDRVDGGPWSYGNDSYPKLKQTYTAGTFCKHPITMASTYAVMQEFISNSNQHQEILNFKTSKLAEKLNIFFSNEKVPIKMVHFGSFFRFASQGNLSFVYQPLELDLFFYHLIFNGVYVWEGKTCFLSTAHNDNDIQKIEHAIYNSVKMLKSAGFWNSNTDNFSPKLSNSILNLNNTNSLSQNIGIEKYIEKNKKIDKKIKFSLYYFGNYDAEYSKDKYNLLFTGAKFADENKFEAIWTPERHFHSFGGFSPNPSILSAALSRETKNLKIRSSLVLPIHHPIRVAEDWAMIDNLSNGRAGVAFASGWHPNDFVFFPDNWGRHREIMFEQIKHVKALWEGRSIQVKGGSPELIEIKIYPQPKQRSLPIWITTLGNSDTYKRAGAIGANILTNMIGQTISELKEKISIYRQSLAENGYDPIMGQVTILLHTLVGSDYDEVLKMAKLPFCNYLNSSVGLFQQMVKGENLKVDFNNITKDDRDYILQNAYNRYVNSSAMIGTPETCSKIVKELYETGVNEIACFIDFGVPDDYVIKSFSGLSELRNCFSEEEDKEQTKLTYHSMAPIVIPDSHIASTIKEKFDNNFRKEPITEDQELLCLLANMSPEGSLAYNNSTTLKLIGNLQVDSLNRAISKVVKRHEALRTVISKDRKLQLIYSEMIPQINYHNFTNSLSLEKIDEQVDNFFENESKRLFDLEKALFRVNLLKIGEDKFLFNITIHHIICDGVSVGIILQDIEMFYSAYAQDKNCILSPSMQFSEFSKWRISQKASNSVIEQEKYWLSKTKSLQNNLVLPMSKPRNIIKTYNGKRFRSNIPITVYEKLKSFSRQNGCTYFMTLLAIYNILLHRLSEQDSVTVGIAFAGRTLSGSEDLVGYCSTIFPISSTIANQLTFVSYLNQLKNQLLEAYDNQDYPFARLIKNSPSQRDRSRSYFFSVAFNWDKIQIPHIHGLEVEYFDQNITATEYDLMPNILEINGQLILNWDYNADLFNEETIRIFADCFNNILNNVLLTPQQYVNRISLLNEENYHNITKEWNHKNNPYNTTAKIHDYLNHSLIKYPNKTFIVYKDNKLTYKQVVQFSDNLANKLIEYYNKKSQQFVAVIMRNNHFIIPTLIGIMKSGNIYVPINPDFPEVRIKQILEDADIKCIISSTELQPEISKYYTGGFIKLEDIPVKNLKKMFLIEDKIKSSDLAYAIYTAGSTGIPKGVPISHKSVINLLEFMITQLKITDKDVFCSVANIGTDMAVPDYYIPLMTGGSVIIVDNESRLQPTVLSSIIKENNVTTMQASPSLLKILLNSNWEGADNLQIISGAEPLSSEIAKKLLSKCSTLWNWYGPTETTVWSTYKKVSDLDLNNRFISIGKPIQNTTIYILDKQMEPMNLGIPGELYIGGDGLSHGYLNREILNRDKFVSNPFNANGLDPVLYKTGDKARYNSFGDLECLGRLDFQVKIRGNRIELYEIEIALKKHERIEEAIVKVIDSQDNELLGAYIKLVEKNSLEKEEVRNYLKNLLPGYMIPEVICFVDKINYTDNGKIDRNNLPEITYEKKTNDQSYQSDNQKIIAEIWRNELKHDNFSINDDFFTIGGNSLMLANIYSKLIDKLKVKFPILELFKFSSVKSIDEYLSKL